MTIAIREKYSAKMFQFGEKPNLFKGLIFDIRKPEARSKIMDVAVIAVQVCIVAGSRVKFPDSVVDGKQPNPFVVCNTAKT